MKATLILMSLVLVAGGALGMLASRFSDDETIFIKGALLLIIGMQIQQDKELWK